MLIQALSEYYDILSQEGKVVADEYSEVNINYIVCLTEDGKIDNLIECEKNRTEIMPKKSEKTSICSNIIEYRALYLFGLNFDKGVFTTSDRTNKAKKSHDDFVKTSLEFLKDLDSPVVNAYRNFIENWNPECETENIHLLSLGKKYLNSNFAFCLRGEIDKLLHKDDVVLRKWLNYYEKSSKENKNGVISQCAITGEKETISRVHDKIKGVPGGLATGAVLIGFNNDSENSYGNEQSFNSNISEKIMRKYTKALNYLLSSKKNKDLFDDVTVIHWAMSNRQDDDDIMSMLMFNDFDDMDARKTDDMLSKMMLDAKEGKVTSQRVSAITGIDENVYFYMAGLKPNSSRLSLKFIYKKKAADILSNIAQHQLDLQISENMKPIPFWVIKRELISPKSSNGKVNPELMTKIFEAAIYGTNYPQALLFETIRCVKTDKIAFNSNRAGIIKACINRKSRIFDKKEEIKMSLDKENKNPAYLCGRLFAVLEKLQQDASGNNLNTTIKDSYFAAAASRPSIVFPKILKLAQNHLKKSNSAAYYNILIEEIIDNLENEFPDMLTLANQGRFMIGYYQQYQSFFTKKTENNTEEE